MSENHCDFFTLIFVLGGEALFIVSFIAKLGAFSVFCHIGLNSNEFQYFFNACPQFHGKKKTQSMEPLLVLQPASLTTLATSFLIQVWQVAYTDEISLTQLGLLRLN